ncbi:MAG: formylglycine-generating enzyme family protein [Desulfuromonadales bacterium]|nr:formylglycine-generating enzyme family protein [Desulfuromonadales bacterium]
MQRILLFFLTLMLVSQPAQAWFIKEFRTSREKMSRSGGSGSGSWTESLTGMEFVRIPGGCFQMGSPANEKDRGSDEGPVHEVCVDGFSIGKFEVTNAQYRKYKSGHTSKDYGGNSLNGDDQPAIYVSWEDATEYAKWLSRQTGKSFRLPTEAEWEYAARAGTRTARWWGESPDQACRNANVADQSAKRKWSNWTVHNCDDGYAVTAPVGRFAANAFGLHDMLGNVWEWCQDWYDSGYYAKSPRQNPQGPSGGSDRVHRGGSWTSGARLVRASNRNGGAPGNRYNYLGFRLLIQDRG